ncbi:hypothetical protein NDU88_004135 [Pleurodeles waltl]|uniref:Uncharacterized protein n=1 Tax=Pleurodeles waltl TaxID=8319 RepID=A0AAV7SHX5_PLEWA|nr:hypothetical protein NDU88_004135 [Pleurodeles waltl]
MTPGGTRHGPGPPDKPSLNAIIAAIQDLKGSLEPKLDVVTVDVTLLQADLKKVVEKVTNVETDIARLQSISKRLENQWQRRSRVVPEAWVKSPGPSGLDRQSAVEVGAADKAECPIGGPARAGPSRGLGTTAAGEFDTWGLWRPSPATTGLGLRP